MKWIEATKEKPPTSKVVLVALKDDHEGWNYYTARWIEESSWIENVYEFTSIGIDNNTNSIVFSHGSDIATAATEADNSSSTPPIIHKRHYHVAAHWEFPYECDEIDFSLRASLITHWTPIEFTKKEFPDRLSEPYQSPDRPEQPQLDI